MYMEYVIYKCYCRDVSENDIYIGSTTDLAQRIKFHKGDYMREDKKLYEKMKLTGGFSNWVFESLENGKEETRKDILMREQYWIEKLNPVLNSANAYLSTEHRRQIWRENRKKYREKYPEKTKAWNDKIAKMKWRCETCNHNYPYSVKARHLKTKKHKDNINAVGVERRPRTNIREDTTRCNKTTQTPQKKSFTEQEYLEVLQNPSNYNFLFE